MRNKTSDTCCLCRKNPAEVQILKSVNFMARQIQIIAMLCADCDRRSDRDHVLDAYIESIFSKR